MGWMRNRVAVWILVSVLSVLAHDTATGAAPASQARAAGYVVAIRGAWRLAGGDAALLKVGQPIPGGVTVEALPDQTGLLSIRIALLYTSNVARGASTAGAAALFRECEGRNCGVIEVPTPTVAPGPWQRLASAVGATFAGNYRQYRMTMARAITGVPDVREAVVPLGAGALDVAAAFERVKSGTYRVELVPVKPAAGGGIVPVVATLDWHSGEKATLSASALRPGLYELSVAATTPQAAVGHAWVWACAPDAVERCRERFAPAAVFVTTWGDDADQAVSHAFLRASLQYLAAEPR